MLFFVPEAMGPNRKTQRRVPLADHPLRVHSPQLPERVRLKPIRLGRGAHPSLVRLLLTARWLDCASQGHAPQTLSGEKTNTLSSSNACQGGLGLAVTSHLSSYAGKLPEMHPAALAATFRELDGKRCCTTGAAMGTSRASQAISGLAFVGRNLGLLAAPGGGPECSGPGVSLGPGQDRCGCLP